MDRFDLQYGRWTVLHGARSPSECVRHFLTYRHDHRVALANSTVGENPTECERAASPQCGRLHFEIVPNLGLLPTRFHRADCQNYGVMKAQPAATQPVQKESTDRGATAFKPSSV